MTEKIKLLITDIELFNPKNIKELDDFRIKYIGKKGIISEMFNELKLASNDSKKELGLVINLLKNKVEETIAKFNNLSEDKELSHKTIDLTLPAEHVPLGSRHPISITHDEIVNIFSRIGFKVAEAPEIEDDWHNFTALNTPQDHPSRDMQDTFFIEKNPDILLRTHTSSVQVRIMETTKPPIRIICPGRVYRNETISARSNCFFHQVEGLYIDKNVSFADLKQTLYYFAQELFDQNIKIRFRASYFPFTEPSTEMDVSCVLCDAKGCKVCKNSGWLEILGCGMVDPAVLDNCKIDSKKYTGFAFGMGIDRITMLKYRIDDIRILFENDIRFLKQFVGILR